MSKNLDEPVDILGDGAPLDTFRTFGVLVLLLGVVVEVRGVLFLGVPFFSLGDFRSLLLPGERFRVVTVFSSSGQLLGVSVSVPNDCLGVVGALGSIVSL